MNRGVKWGEIACIAKRRLLSYHVSSLSCIVHRVPDQHSE